MRVFPAYRALRPLMSIPFSSVELENPSYGNRCSRRQFSSLPMIRLDNPIKLIHSHPYLLHNRRTLCRIRHCHRAVIPIHCLRGFACLRARRCRLAFGHRRIPRVPTDDPAHNFFLMIQPHASTPSIVTKRRVIAPGLVTLRFHHPRIARETKAGQFVNVLPKAGFLDPMLRRPFSVYCSEGDEAEIIVQAHGRGTGILAETREGEMLDVLGPLGKPWMFNSADYITAVLLIGGVGVASMPMLTRALEQVKIPIQTFYGARTKSLFALDGLVNLQLSTDDGSDGTHGSNVA